ncbi:B12-binding domain-containing radical SAM protein [Tissierella pigra]|uniref:B12-binding domain-containing radical SAM protein n=1 Tax=Tissierella pigra TaxID=2607614 RepID=A0A6N7XZY7_9FIRM|nr:radical SAM protein [Tissierella pigra]MBU5427697.1 B12-binding domain-containing radical SAM protein [Tissierella pigra]MSU03053.1 B12-binding domain-containing radical SAM protein [Tissierella pigra]
MKTKLIFPPFWICNAPYLSVPSLVAFLEHNNVEVEQIDLNLEFIDKMLSSEFLKLCKNRIYLQDENNEVTPYFKEIINFGINNIEMQKDIFRSERSLNISTYEQSKNTIALAFAIINKSFKGENIENYYYESSYNREDFRSIIQAANDSFNNMNETLISILFNYFIDDIVKNADLIGFSLTGLDQIIPTFILAGAIKRVNSDIKIVIGGSIPTRWFARKEYAPYLFDYIDYVILNEGEKPLLSLIQYLNNERTIESVPQLVYAVNNKIMFNDLTAECVPMSNIPTPVFNINDLERYLTPKKVLPLLGSRGCYWRKCTFCDHSFIYKDTFRQAPVDKIIGDLKIYAEKYGAHYVNFHDEAMTPSIMEELSRKIIDSNLSVKWSTDARLDKKLTYDILELASKSGLSVIFFGLESVNDRVVGLIDKGTKIDITQRIIEDVKRAGIASHMFFICGFPTETIMEYQETINFIEINKDIIASHGCSRFGLGKYSPIAKNPQKYNVIITNLYEDFNASLSYKFTRIDIEKNYFDKIEKLYSYVTKELETYAQKIFHIIIREHWVIFWESLDFILSDVENKKNSKCLKSGVFVIETESQILLYDSAAKEVFEFDLSAKFVIDLIFEYGIDDKKRLIQKSSEHYNISQDQISESIEEFTNLLKEKELVFKGE